MEKKRVIQFGKRAEHPIIEENRRISDNGRIELTTERPHLHNSSIKDMNEPIDRQQNIWRSHLLSSGARNQPWFDKLQDYRNEV